jgi:hypothetical protein
MELQVGLGVLGLSVRFGLVEQQLLHGALLSVDHWPGQGVVGLAGDNVDIVAAVVEYTGVEALAVVAALRVEREEQPAFELEHA